MKCERCGATATIHTTTIVAGCLVEHHVCPEHAPQPDDEVARALAQAKPRPLPPSPFYSDPELFDAVQDADALRQFHMRLLPELAGSLLDENPKVPETYQIRGIPTILIFKGGQVVESVVGLAQKEDLKKVIDKHI